MMDNPAQPNYFEFYNLPVALSVDEGVVRRIFLENSRKFHPDFHTLSSEEVQNQSLELSTLNNEAFKTFSDPDRLLQYVLKIKGLLTAEGGEGQLPQSFLMDMMEINEKIISLEFDPGSAQYEEALAAVNSLESSLEASVGTILHQWTEASGNASDLLTAKEYFLKKRYLLRVKENLSKFASAFE
ncbi:MAG: Fe-S protein assembly co-chaperone HscB [Saprospiraceae bacterium]|jgi:molecular chaperone HscB|nr:Fe-S protein assembly co-chaperone HscB [Saprospiraceae bacterium]